MSITDNVAATSLPTGESFQTLMAPTSGQVIRGVSFVPTAQPGDALPEVPWVPAIPIVGGIVGGLACVWHRRLRLRATALTTDGADGVSARGGAPAGVPSRGASGQDQAVGS